MLFRMIGVFKVSRDRFRYVFNLPNHSKQHMTVCGLSLHQGSTESRKTLEQFFFSNRLS